MKLNVQQFKDTQFTEDTDFVVFVNGWYNYSPKDREGMDEAILNAQLAKYEFEIQYWPKYSRDGRNEVELLVKRKVDGREDGFA